MDGCYDNYVEMQGVGFHNHDMTLGKKRQALFYRNENVGLTFLFQRFLMFRQANDGIGCFPLGKR